MQNSSRLTRTSKEKLKKQSIFFGIAILVLLGVLFQFGPFLLDSAGKLMSGFSKPANTTATTHSSTLEAPFISSIPEATNSARIHVVGTSAYSDAQIELYLNGDEYDTTPLSADQKFIFDEVILKEGSNLIKLRVKKDESVSEFTRNYTVEYNPDDAKLEITSPSDNAEFKRGDQTIQVTGTTDPDSSVTVNGSVAIVDSEGKFSYFLSLNDGDNTISIDAQSAGGKIINKIIKVKYNP